MATSLRLVLLLLVCALCVEATSVTCAKNYKKTVTINEGDSFTYQTQSGNEYVKKSKCKITYKKHKKCSAMKFSCSAFSIHSPKVNCKGGDKMVLFTKEAKNKKYCQTTGPDVTTTGNKMKVTFTSNGKTEDTGAICTVECVSGTPVTECCTDCSLDYPAIPPYYGTSHDLKNTLTEDDPSSFQHVSSIGTSVVDFMWGPFGWEEDVSVWQFSAFFSDVLGSVTVSCDLDSFSQTECENFAELFSLSLGRVPSYGRSAVHSLHIRPGTYGNPEGCTAWGGSGTITMCSGVGEQLISDETIEELFLHEGAHVTLDPFLLDAGGAETEKWACARDLDHAYISDYAKDFPTREDVSESFPAWYAHAVSPERQTEEDLNKIRGTIPNRLEVLSSYILNKKNQKIMPVITSPKQKTKTKPEDPEVIAPYLFTVKK